MYITTELLSLTLTPLLPLLPLLPPPSLVAPITRPTRQTLRRNLYVAVPRSQTCWRPALVAAPRTSAAVADTRNRKQTNLQKSITGVPHFGSFCSSLFLHMKVSRASSMYGYDGSTQWYTVEPPNKVYYGTIDFVPCREVVPISGVK